MKKSKKKPVSEPSIVIEIFILNKYNDNDAITNLSKPKTMNILSPKEQQNMAKELAKALNDWQALAFYVTVCQKYPKDIIYEVLAKVLAIPNEKIRKTRGALFNSLIQQYGPNKSYSEYDGDEDYWD